MNRKKELIGKAACKKEQKANKIPSIATELKQASTDSQYPVFSFKNVCSNHCQLSDWQGRELLKLITTFKTMESLPWGEVRNHKGLNLKPIEQCAFRLPDSVPEDVVIQEVKVDKKRRLFGYRAGRVFYLIWFDRNHDVVPMGKSKGKKA